MIAGVGVTGEAFAISVAMYVSASPSGSHSVLLEKQSGLRRLATMMVAVVMVCEDGVLFSSKLLLIARRSVPSRLLLIWLAG